MPGISHETHVNTAHIERLSWHERLGLAITSGVGTMWCAFLFASLALIALPQALGSMLTFIQWLSQTFIQLTMLSVLAVGQNLQARHAELKADVDHENLQWLREHVAALEQSTPDCGD